MTRILSLLLMMALLIPLQVAAQTYNLGPTDTTIQFKVRNMLIMNVKGSFEKFKGTVIIDDADITKSKIDVTIETASINTGIDTRDNHLRSPDFFDVVKFPFMTFVSTKVEPDKDNYKVTGNLTIKGVTKQGVLFVGSQNSLKENPERTATVTTMVNRQDFGVSWGGMIADEVYVSVSSKLHPLAIDSPDR